MNTLASLNLSAAPRAPLDAPATAKLLLAMDAAVVLLQDLPAAQGPEAAEGVEADAGLSPQARELLERLASRYPHTALSAPREGRVCAILSASPLETVVRAAPAEAPAGEGAGAPAEFSGPAVLATTSLSGRRVALASASWAPPGPDGAPAADPCSPALDPARAAAAGALEAALEGYARDPSAFTVEPAGPGEGAGPAPGGASAGAPFGAQAGAPPQAPYAVAALTLWRGVPPGALRRLPAYVKDGAGATYPQPDATVEADHLLGTPEPRLLVCRHYAEKRAGGSGCGHRALRLDFALK